MHSALLLSRGVIKRVWPYLLLTFVTLPGAFDRYKWILPRDIHGESMPLWVSFGLLGIGLSYAIFATYHELNARAELMQQQLVPKLNIVFGQGPPFEEREIWVGSTEVQRRWFRIGVKNIGMVTLDEVVVRLEELYDLSQDPPGKSPVPPIVLRQMNDDPIDGRYQQSFTLNPGSTQFIEVAWKPEADITTDSDEIRLGYAQTAPSMIPCRRHELFIQATGRDVLAQGQWFFIDIDQDGHLLFGQRNCASYGETV